MTMTLRRELKKVIQKAIEEQEDKLWSIGFYSDGGMDAEGLAEKIADAILEMKAFKPKAAFDEKQADPAWQILFGDRKQEDVNNENIRLEAFAGFERSLQLPDSWYWYSSAICSP